LGDARLQPARDLDRAVIGEPLRAAESIERRLGNGHHCARLPHLACSGASPLIKHHLVRGAGEAWFIARGGATADLVARKRTQSFLAQAPCTAVHAWRALSPSNRASDP